MHIVQKVQKPEIKKNSQAKSFELKVSTYFEFFRLKFKVRKYSVEWADFVSRSS